MPKIEIGEYLAILHNVQGDETGRVLIVPRKRFPLIGEAIPLDGKNYRVRDIQHPPEDSDGFERFVYTDLVAYLVEEQNPAGAGPTDGGSKDRHGTKPGSSPSLAATVIPFRGSSVRASSPLLGFLKLVAVAVATGYQEQAYQLERLKLARWVIEWDGDRWIAMETTGGRTSDELREMSRGAKRAGAEAEAFCRDILSVVSTEAEEHVAVVIELASFRRG